MSDTPEVIKHDKSTNRFLFQWFSGLERGLKRMDDAARSVLLQECGKACADSYTAEQFRQAKAESGDLDDFLHRLAQRFPEAAYKKISANSLNVCYSRCECDLVKRRLVTTPLLCECSMHNLKANFEAALGVPVEVTTESTILRGNLQCAFVVRWDEG